MPFKSKAQARYFRVAEAQGKLPKGTAHRWAQHTPDMKHLPEKKKAVLQGGLLSMQLGQQAAQAPALGMPMGPQDAGKIDTGVTPLAAQIPGPLTSGAKGLFGLRKSPVPGRGFPPTVSNMSGQVRPVK